MRNSIATAICFSCLASLGCEPAPNALAKLPAHWRCVREQGTDSSVGKFVSSEESFAIEYDIGEMAGDYAKSDSYAGAKWRRSRRIADSSFEYLLDRDDTLIVTFPDEGPANFLVRTIDPAKIDYVIELLVRHRQKLLQSR